MRKGVCISIMFLIALQPFNSNAFQPLGESTSRVAAYKRDSASYKVRRLSSSIKIDANWNKWQWKAVQAVLIKEYMGKLPKLKSTVQAKMMYDATNLYVIFKVLDYRVRYRTKEINGPVWEDNCVELFFSPDTMAPLKYFNLEINCIGVPLMHYNAVASKDIVNLSAADIKNIKIAHSLRPNNEKEIAGPITWTLEYKLPLALLRKYAPVTNPEEGVTWYANFYKIAHKSSNPHYMSWSYVDVAGIDMHMPEFFGKLIFQ
jgi:hypothetical protein